MDKRAQLPTLRVTLSAPLTDRPWRALWDWLLAPPDQGKAASAEEEGENYTLSDYDSDEVRNGEPTDL